MITVCAWCESGLDGVESQPAVQDRGEPLSHGICEAHAAALLKELYERRDNQDSTPKPGLLVDYIPRRGTKDINARFARLDGAETVGRNAGSRSQPITGTGGGP